MKIDGDYVFNGPREDVWALIRDPEALANALPGTETLTRLSDNEYEGVMNVRIGPISGVFSGKVTISDETPPECCTRTAEGRGAQGFAKGIGRVQLIDQGDGTTLMKYDGDVQIGGKLASVGQRSLDSVSKSMIRQGLESLNGALEARVSTQATGQEVIYVPPPEAEFAANVMRDMAGRFLSSPQAAGARVAIAGVLGLLIGFLLGRLGRRQRVLA